MRETELQPREAETDAQLIGERFAEVFDRHYEHIHAYAARRLGPDLAEDVAAETFLVAYDRRDRFDPAHADARPWLYGIASNLVMRHARAEARRYKALARSAGTAEGAGHGSGDGGVADAVAGRVDAAGVRGRLAAALARLSLADRDVLLLVAWAGLSQAEAAEALGVPPGTVRSRLHRARQAMRTAIGTDLEVHE